MDNISLHCVFAISIAECPVLPDPLNGEVTLTGFSVGDSSFYSCDDGFELVGNSPRTCQSNNAWSGEEPMCRRTSLVIIFCLHIMIWQNFPNRYNIE